MIASILAQNYAGKFVLGHYVFLKVHSFLPAGLSENLSLFKTDNVHGELSMHIFAPNRGYCLYNTAAYIEVARGRTHML